MNFTGLLFMVIKVFYRYRDQNLYHTTGTRKLLYPAAVLVLLRLSHKIRYLMFHTTDCLSCALAF